MSFKDYIPYYKRNLKMAVPIMLSQLGGAVVTLADGIMVGQLGTISLAAASFATSINIIFFIFGSATLIGATPLVGYAYVQRRFQKAGRLFQHTLMLSLMIAAVLLSTLGLLSFALPHMGQEEAVVKEATSYYHLINWSLLPFFIFCAFRQFFEGIGNTKISMAIIITTNIINIFLNWVFIFGHLGAPMMGIEGAGLATLISRILMPIAFLIAMICRRNWRLYLTYFRWPDLSFRPIASILKVGLPIGGHQLLEVSAFALSAIFAGWISSTAQAAHLIAQNVGHLAYMTVLGLSSATIIRVSHQYGIKNMNAVKMAATASIHLGLVINSITALTIILTRNLIPHLFSTDPAVISMASLLIVMVGLFQLSDGMQAVCSGILRGLSDVNKPIIYAFFAYLVINIPLGLFLAFGIGLGATGLWLSLITGLTVTAILLFRRVRIQIGRLMMGKSILQ